MIPKSVRFWARLGVLAGLSAILALTVDLGAAFRQLRDADPAYMLAGLALVQVQIVLSALRWKMTARRLGQDIPAARAIGEYYAASLVNLVLPGGVAGDVGRAIRSRASIEAGDGALRRAALRAVVLERVAGQIVFVAIALAGLAAWPLLLGGAAPERAAWQGWIIAAIVLAGVLAVAIATRSDARWLKHAFADLGSDMRKAWLADGAWAGQLTLSVAIGAGYILLFAICAAAVDAPVPAVALATVIPAVLLTMLVPFSIGGWGIREGAAAALWPLIGLAPAAGVATGVLYGLVTLAGSAPGLPILAFSRRGHDASSRRA